MKKRLGVLSVVTILVMAFFALSAAASYSELFFTSDKNGTTRVTNIQEGSQVWMVVIDPDENIDCDVRDKFWTDAKLFDPKTGAYINFAFAPARSGDPVPAYGLYDPGHSPKETVPSGIVYFEETGADTNKFVSSQPIQIGTRLDYAKDEFNTHWVGLDFAGVEAVNGFHGPLATDLNDLYGQFLYKDGVRAPVLEPIDPEVNLPTWVTPYHGRFENMDTLIGMIVDQNDETDVATAMLKIVDWQGTVTWDQPIYSDGNEAATLTIVDKDENLNCNVVEYVPVFIIVNPESWNPQEETNNPTGFCALKRTGGVDPVTGVAIDVEIAWYNIYNSGLTFPVDRADPHAQGPAMAGNYYIHYPTQDEGNVSWFDTADEDGITWVMFYAMETGVDEGEFELNLNSILDDLGFRSLRDGDVLVAYYLDPNDEDDFQVGAAYIGQRNQSVTMFTDADRVEKDKYWIGRDPVYVTVIDANANENNCCPEQVVVHVCDPHEWDDTEWLVLDEVSMNASVFFTSAGTQLLPVWNGMGVGTDPSVTGGYQLQLDNWKLEVYNEDHVYVQYNDALYETDSTGLGGLGDIDEETAFPPVIRTVRVANDVSFDLMEIGDTQVYTGGTPTMQFLKADTTPVTDGYTSSSCVFIEVVDADQNEDTLRRERIAGFWDNNQNLPFGPQALRAWECTPADRVINPINALLGDTNIFVGPEAHDTPYSGGQPSTYPHGFPNIYVLNPRSGNWAALDLLETGVSTGKFVSVACVDVSNTQYPCVPSLGALPGDTIVAFYMDPSNHSDSAMIQVKVGIGGGTTPPSQKSTTTFVNAAGAPVTSYTDADLVYVKVVDASHAGAATLAGLTVNGQTVTLTHPATAPADTFMTAGLDLPVVAGDTIAATYKDPSDSTDTSSATATVVASKLEITKFFAGPTPAVSDVTFGYKGTGVAKVMSVVVYDLAGQLVRALDKANTSTIVWDAKDESGAYVANGAYIYVITASDGTTTFPGKGVLFINR